MARRVVLALTALLAIVVALAGVASASASAAARQDRGPRAHIACKRVKRARRRRCYARAARVARREATRHAKSKHGSPVPPVSGGLVVGLNADAAGWGGASTAGRLDLVSSATGTRWLREEFDWATVEPSPGVFDFSYYDHFMLLAAQRGLHVLPVLYDTPAWAGSSYNAIPSDPTAFARYAAALVGRYGANGSFWAENPTLRSSAIGTWEIWNEPYLGSGDNGHYDPGAYARLVKAAAIAGRGADPNAKFLLAAEMQSARDANGNWQWWVDALYQAVPDLNSYFDGVAMHDYGTDTTTLNPIIPGQPYPNDGHILRIEDLHQQFVNHGGAGKPFWITEAGWSTCNDSPDCVTPTQQASNLATLFNDIHTRWSSWVHAAFIYRYGDGANPTSTQDAYGLTNLDGSPKPALAVFQQEAAASA
jgi:polysaccharide biosynthesis protein PslG